MKILITGISGTLGTHVKDILLENEDNKIIGYSRCEQKQRLIPKHKNLILYLGDVRDEDRILEASRGCDMILHFAALKCVDTLEDNPEESIKTNVEGTMNVLHAQRMNGIRRVVLSSTDKAVYPINSYGACKMLAERLVMKNPNNVVVRYGNVLASRGSVIPMFIETIKNENKAYITNDEMTRFFLTPKEAAQFVIKSSFDKDGGLKIPELKSASIIRVARSIANLMNRKPEFVNIGIRAGEKIHEALKTSKEEGGPIFSNTHNPFTDKELLEKLRPFVSELL